MRRATRSSHQRHLSDRAADQPENVTIDAASYSDEELIGFVTRSAPRNVYIIPERSADAAARAQTLAERLRHESQIIATIAMGDPQYPAGRRAADVIILVKGTP